MPILFNSGASAYTTVQVSVGQAYGQPVILALFLNPVPEDNRRKLGQLYFYRRIVDPAFTEWVAIEQKEPTQRRTGIRFTYSLVATDIIRFIPFYDINQVVIMLQQSGA